MLRFVVIFIVLQAVVLFPSQDAAPSPARDDDRIAPHAEDKRLPASRRYERATEALRFPALLAEFGTNKDLAEGYALQALIALSRYPELVETRIRFRVRRSIVPIMALPRFFSLFRRRSKRGYTVMISRAGPEGIAPLRLANQSFNGQIGIIAHELAHIVDYESRNFLQMGRLGARYLTRKGRNRVEREADRTTIARGFGRQLYAHRQDIAESEFADGDSPHAYLSTFEVLSQMGRTGLYPGLSWIETHPPAATPETP
jgi:hypothetical protein